MDLEIVRRALARGPCSLGELISRIEELTGEKVSPMRLKRLLLRERPKWLGVDIRLRRSRSRRPRCPVCGAKMMEALGRTVEGEIEALYLRCPRCGFETLIHDRKTPARYLFYLLPENLPVNENVK